MGGSDFVGVSSTAEVVVAGGLGLDRRVTEVDGCSARADSPRGVDGASKDPLDPGKLDLTLVVSCRNDRDPDCFALPVDPGMEGHCSASMLGTVYVPAAGRARFGRDDSLIPE